MFGGERARPSKLAGRPHTLADAEEITVTAPAIDDWRIMTPGRIQPTCGAPHSQRHNPACRAKQEFLSPSRGSRETDLPRSLERPSTVRLDPHWHSNDPSIDSTLVYLRPSAVAAVAALAVGSWCEDENAGGPCTRRPLWGPAWNCSVHGRVIPQVLLSALRHGSIKVCVAGGKQASTRSPMADPSLQVIAPSGGIKTTPFQGVADVVTHGGLEPSTN